MSFLFSTNSNNALASRVASDVIFLHLTFTKFRTPFRKIFFYYPIRIHAKHQKSEKLKSLRLREKKREKVFNPLSDDRILASSKLKTCADDNFNVANMMQSFFNKVYNIVGKGENCGDQHFCPFPTFLSQDFVLRVV